MIKRIHIYVSSLVLVLLSFTAESVEVGALQLRSLLNEPLDAKIMLSKTKEIEKEAILVSIGDRDVYATLGLEPVNWIYNIHLVTEKDPKTGKIRILLSTEDPIKDPYADLVIVVTWEGGKIIKEYVILLDPPKSIVSSSLAKGPVKKAKKLPVDVDRKQPVSTVARQDNTLHEEFRIATRIQNRSMKRRLDRATARVVRPGGHYELAEEDNLWSIAKKLVKNTPYSVNQGVAAIAYKNPGAFKEGNINSFVGLDLELPTPHDLASFSEEDARYFIEAQNEDWKDNYTTVSQASAVNYLYPEQMNDAQEQVKLLQLAEAQIGGGSQEEVIRTLQRMSEAYRKSTELADLVEKQAKEIEQLKSMMLKQEGISKTSSGTSMKPPQKSSEMLRTPVLWGGVGIGAVLLLFMGYWFVRREKGEEEFLEDTIKEEFDIEKALMVLSQEEKKHVRARDKQEALEREVPLEEVDGLMAQERYGQAKKILQAILVNNPHDWNAFVKLLELYVITESYESFNREYTALPSDLETLMPEIWSKIENLKRRTQGDPLLSTSHELLKPEEIKVALDSAKMHIEAGNYDMAQKYLLKIRATKDPEQKDEIEKLLIQMGYKL